MSDSIKEIFLYWEKRCIWYNLILFIEGIWLLIIGSWLLQVHLSSAFTRFWVLMVLFAIIANICYFIGPLVEIFTRTLLGSHTEKTRYQSFVAGFPCFLFWVGLLLSMGWVWMWVFRGLKHL